NVARYLWNNFLGGQSDSRPLVLLHVNSVVLIQTTSRIIGTIGPIFKKAKYFWVCLRLKMQLTVATSHPMCLIMKCSAKYGGVMVWSRFYDQNYSSAIESNV
ncbi:acidic endochitinase, partial [Quercus suber]